MKIFSKLHALKARLYPLSKIENLLVRRAVLLVHIPIIAVTFLWLHASMFVRNFFYSAIAEVKSFGRAWIAAPRHLVEDAMREVKSVKEAL